MNGFFNGIANSKSRTITAAAFILAGSALTSRVLGLIRDRILAGKFGAGDELDVYYAAFRIPDTLYSILVLGAISSAFIPVFSGYLVKDEKYAWKFVNNTLTILAGILSGISLAIFVLAPFLLRFIAPGFDSEKQQMTVLLTRIMFLSPLLFGLSSIFSSILQTFQRFLIYSLAPIVYNIGIIIGALYLTELAAALGRERVVGLAAGVILGVLFHILIQIPGVHASGFSYRPSFNIREPGFLEVLKLTVPRTIGITAYQASLIVTTAIASMLPAGRIAVFNFANNLQHVPIGIIGISFAMAAFPVLSKNFARNEREELIKTFSSTFREILFLVFPLMIALILLRAQIVRLILGTGQFGWEDTRLTAASLGLFGISIFAQSLAPLLLKSFYSLHDTRTPVAISLVAIAVNVFLSFFLVQALSFPGVLHSFFVQFLDLAGLASIAVIGLPFAFSLASILNFFLLLLFFRRKLGKIDGKAIAVSTLKIGIASTASGVAIYMALGAIASFVNMETGFGILVQTAGAACMGGGVYLVTLFLLKSRELTVFWQSLGRLFVR